MSGKSFVVVGGSNGIGLELTRQLSERGDQVFVLSRSNERLGGLQNVTHLAFDAVNDELDANQIPGELHGLAYCPGTINLKSFRALTVDQFRDDFEINVIGAVNVIKSLTNSLKKGAGESTSSILLFSTVAVGQGMPLHASVAVSKGAIEGLTRTLAAELSPLVRVNCVAPALTKTKLTERFFADDAKAAGLAERYPLKRTGTASELAAMSEFLLSDSSGWITGQVFGVDGGMSAVRK